MMDMLLLVLSGLSISIGVIALLIGSLGQGCQSKVQLRQSKSTVQTGQAKAYPSFCPRWLIAK